MNGKTKGELYKHGFTYLKEDIQRENFDYYKARCNCGKEFGKHHQLYCLKDQWELHLIEEGIQDLYNVERRIWRNRN